MDIDSCDLTEDQRYIKATLAEWANAHSDIREVHIYGSRARGDFKEVSDLDIAVAVNLSQGDVNGVGVFVGEKERWQRQWDRLFPYTVHLD